MTETSEKKAGFLASPTTWKAVLLVVAYLAFYLAVSHLVGWLFGGLYDTGDPIGSATGILVGLAAPIAIAGVALVLFASWAGWLPEILGGQPIGGRRWMWIAPVIVVLAIVAHVAGVEWSEWSAGQVVALLVLGVCVGFTEEFATRGLVVKVVRDAGHGERYVAAVSSLLFALLHLSNLISGMKASTVLATVVYTLGFGMCMYLTMRVTGTIWAAIVLHALTDPTGILASGGIDESVVQQSAGSAVFGFVATTFLIVFGIVSVFFVRGQVRKAASAQ